MERTLKAVILGSGNVATHLAKKLSETAEIIQIYSRDPAHARQLADSIGAEATSDLRNISDEADIYIVSVSDDAIPEIASAMKGKSGLWVHTSGSVPMEVLSEISNRYGVLYPMQTFSKDVEVAMEEVPVFIEGNSPETLGAIERVARLISPRVKEADSEARKKLHIAAVFACNFTNYLWGFSVDILESIGLDLSIMEPLVKATFQKALKVSPRDGQTGPARRRDMSTINKHIDALDGRAKEIYSQLSLNIIDTYDNEQS